MSHKIDQRLIQSEKSIIEAGIKTLLANPSAGMSEIAQTAGVGRATLYRHFKSREALIQRLAMICFEETEVALKPYEHLEGRTAIEAIIDALMPMGDRFRFLVNLWSYAAEDAEFMRIDAESAQEMAWLVDQAKSNGEIAADLPTAWVVEFFDGTLTAGWMLAERGDVTTAEAAVYVKRSFFRGCGS